MERLLQRDVVVRILSVLLAILLWVQVTGDQQTVENRTIRVPLQLQNLAAGTRLIGDPLPAEVRLDLSGPRRYLSESNFQAVVATVDVAGREPGTAHNLPVMVLGLPEHVQLVAKRPEWVSLRLERFVTRTVELALPPEDRERRDGEYRYTLTLVDRQVELSGLEPQVKQVERVVVAADFGRVEEPGHVLLPVKALDAQGQPVPDVQVQPAQVTALATMEPLPPAKLLAVRVQVAGQPPDGYTYAVQSDPPEVRVRGDLEYHRAWQEIRTRTIPLTGQTRTFTTSIPLVAPEGADLVEPERVNVTVTIREVTLERNFADVPVAVRNVKRNLEGTLAVQEVNVRVFGPKQLLDQFDPAALELHVDAGDLGPGTHQLPVRWVKPEGIEVLLADPARLAVTLSEPAPAEAGDGNGSGEGAGETGRPEADSVPPTAGETELPNGDGR